MQEYLPKPLEFDWKHFLIRGRYQSIYLNETTRHIQAIAKSLPVTSHKELNQKFEDEKFWNILREKSGFHPDIEILVSEWRDQKAFANLSARDLRKIKENHLDPLEVSLLRTVNELEEDLKAYQEFGFWRPNWYIRQHQELIDKTSEQIKDLYHFKSKLQENILLRCNMHEQIGEDRYLDDFHYYFAKKINQLNLLDEPLKISSEASRNLDDDTRVMFYDWLKNTYPKDKKNFSKIIAPITQRPYKTPSSKKQADEANNNIMDFCKAIELKLNLTSTARALEFRKQESQQKDSFLSSALGWLASWFVSKKMKTIWRYRWPLSLFVSLSLYVVFAPSIVVPMTVTYGSVIGSLVANGLFFGGALLPAWLMLGSSISSIGKSIHNAFSYWKIKEVQEGLELLKSNQRFITSNFKPGILDIEHYDIKGLEQSALAKVDEIDKLLLMLNNTSLYQKLVLQGELKTCWQKTKQQLALQKDSMLNDLKIMASHVSLRVKVGVSSLKVNPEKTALTAKMPKGQLNALSRFVETYGDENAKKIFKNNTNIANLFLEAVKNKELIAPTEISAVCNEPWGGFKLLSPSFKGWHTLINGYELDEQKRAASNQLLELLQGKCALNKKEFGALILRLAPEGQSAQFALIVQNYLFLTLDRRPASNAALLSPQQQGLIKDWYKEHQVEVKRAQNLINNALKSKRPDRALSRVTEEQLAQYYKLLDGADYYAAISGEHKDSVNKIRVFFEGYAGNSAKAIYFVRFVPEEKKSKAVQDIASKRLGWLIGQLELDANGCDPFTDTDIELFQNVRLLEEDSSFSFSDTIRNHPKFEARWSEKMEQFLDCCKSSGLDDGGLLKEYQAKNVRVKDFIKAKPDKYTPLSKHTKQKKQDFNKNMILGSKTTKGVARNAV